MPEFIVITGLSGAGRSEAAKHLEDLGWFVIDNLPPALLPKVSELASAPGSAIDRVALVVGAGQYHDGLLEAIDTLREEIGPIRILFLQARTPVLVRRYESTRRPHPFDARAGLANAIGAERQALEPLRAQADVVIDTSDLNVHELRDRVIEVFGHETGGRPLALRVMSFGFKHGTPLDVDMMLDCRFLANPHWVEELRPHTGKDEPVATYLEQQDLTEPFVDRVEELLELLLPAFLAEGKSYLTVAFGCTGGHHRSVYVAERVAAHLRELGYDPSIDHRDIDR